MQTKLISWLEVHTVARQAQGRATVQAVSRLLLSSVTRLRSQVTPRGISGGESGTNRGFFKELRFALSLLLIDLWDYSLVYYLGNVKWARHRTQPRTVSLNPTEKYKKIQQT
jgi:hypothetical protein